nr:LytTR family DNA-binding domain-containing protein [uncultured Arsenicibacter sp.]
MTIRHYLIIDDNTADAEILVSQLGTLTFLQLIAVAPTLEEAIDVLESKSVDLIFLDVRLASQSGLTLLKAVPSLPPVIIISAYPEYAVASYEIGKAADFVLKPVSDERLQIAVTRALKNTAEGRSLTETDSIFFKAGRKMIRLRYSEVDYIQAYDAYCKVFNGEQMILISEPFFVVNRALPGNLFVRVHKSYLINVTKITGYDRQHLWIGKCKIPIGGSYKAGLQKLFTVLGNLDDDEPAT